MTDRPIEFWATSRDEEQLTHRTIKDAIEAWAEEKGIDWTTDAFPFVSENASIDVYGFASQTVEEEECRFLGELFERLDCEYGPDDGGVMPSDSLLDPVLKTLHALETTVAQLLAKNYEPSICELVETRTVNPLDYLRGENA